MTGISDEQDTSRAPKGLASKKVNEHIADGVMRSYSSIYTLRTYMARNPSLCSEAGFTKPDPIDTNWLENPDAYLSHPGMSELLAARDTVRFRVIQISESFSVARKFTMPEPGAKWPMKVTLGNTTYTYTEHDYQQATLALLDLSQRFNLDLEKLAKLRNELTHDTQYAAYGMLWNDVMLDTGLIQKTLNAVNNIFNDDKLHAAYVKALPTFKKPAVEIPPPVSHIGAASARREAAASLFKSSPK